MATIREYGRKCWHHVHAAWQTGELILGIGVAAVSYFGLSAAPVPPWLVYVGAIVFTLLYFIAIVQFRVWRTEAIQVQSLEVRSPGDLDGALQAATRQHASALITVEDPLTLDHRQRIADFAAKNRLPAIYGLREFVDAGGSWPMGRTLLT